MCYIKNPIIINDITKFKSDILDLIVVCLRFYFRYSYDIRFDAQADHS